MNNGRTRTQKTRLHHKQSLSKAGAAWVRSYKAEVETIFTKRFQECEDRFANWKRLLARFSEAVAAVLNHGRDKFRAVDEAHNEICIAYAILSNQNPKFGQVHYEPSLPGSTKSIDFRATTDDGLTAFIDVKTITPKPKDCWDQFQRALKEQWLPENVQVLLSERWLGGELWHNMFAARSRMLEHTLELESKIAVAGITTDSRRFVLALCRNGFYWDQDELEDFVSLYRTGRHRLDDPFSKVEMKHIEENGITLARTINLFAYMCRPQGVIDCKRLNWNVVTPSCESFQ